jgi:hypothetical protein
MGTGVGEAMIIGAVTGAGTSAITGGDPLKGALLGAAGGGVGAGIAGAGAGAGAASGAGSAAAPITTASTTGATTGATMGSAAPITSVGLPEAAGQVGMSALPSGASVPSMMMPSGDISMLASQTPGTASSAAAGSPTFPSMNAFYARNPVMMPAGLGAASAAIGQSYDQDGLPEQEKYSGPLSRFRYDPDKYRTAMAGGGLADSAVAQRYMRGGHLGAYSDGGRLTKGPGDGMSDSIPATIGRKQPARLADSEFVVPADVVSHLGNGSTDAGAKRLYEMMDRVRKARTGRKSQGKEINPSKYMPA